MHGVQVVHQGLHGLEGRAVGIARGVLGSVGNGRLGDGSLDARLGQLGQHCSAEALVHLERGHRAGSFLDAGQQLLDERVLVGHFREQVHGLGQVLLEQATIGLAHAHGRAVVEVAHALATMLVVLVRLDGDAGQRRVAGDVVGLAQHAVAGGEAALEQLAQLDLTAGGGQGVEVHVVDVDVALAVGLGETRVDDAHLVELLGRLRAVLQHGAHGGVGVDVGVLALHVGIGRLGEGDVLQRLDQAAVDVAHAVALGAVEDVCLGRLDEALLDEGLLHQVLHALDRGGALYGAFLDLLGHLRGYLVGRRAVLHGGARGERLLDRLGYLLDVEFGCTSISFNDRFYHDVSTFSLSPLMRPIHQTAASLTFHIARARGRLGALPVGRWVPSTGYPQGLRRVIHYMLCLPPRDVHTYSRCRPFRKQGET